jgi:hypothetical protein
MSHTSRELLVTLANGTQVPWSVFKTWSAVKQQKNLVPTRHSQEARAKISKASSTRQTDAEVRAQISARSKETNARPEVKEKIRASSTGRPGRTWTPEQRQAYSIQQQLEREAGLRKTTKGVKYSEARRQQCSEVGLKRKTHNVTQLEIQTPAGTFWGIEAVAQHYQVTPMTIGRWLKTKPDSFYRTGNRRTHQIPNPNAK